MTKQVINVGSAANDGSGTPARTAFQYINANFTELYDFLTGTPNGTTIPTALPIAKGGTGATSAAAARTNLGLGDAATMTKTASNTDATLGRSLAVGNFGIGRGIRVKDTDASGDLNKVITPGFYGNDTFASGTLALNFPVAGQVGTLIVTDISGGNDYRAQIYIPLTGGSVSGNFFFRSTADLGATWSPWTRLISSNSLDYQRLLNNGFAANKSLGSAALSSFDNGGSFIGLQNTSTGAAAAGDYPTAQAQYILGLNVGSASEHAANLSIATSATYIGFRRKSYQGAYTPWYALRGEHNTTVDANGFIKSASPVAKLFADSIELNDDAQKQPITLEKLGVGDYLIKGSLGFAQEGWYIEMPKDANGNVLVAVAYKQLENNDISIKTYKKKFDIETASIVPDLENPVDIPEGRNIDIRFHEEIVLEETLPDDIEQ
ncbi:pyocin knob domain-containing protein [Acinetobacter baumannii]|uniref:pyocin knob domain-containing protein n=1 Tax=Acinetobacter baumannii TaxID=470 RepID=UPI00059AE4C0|nr:pyocin knob domain-containing protein [Acinetobacter baumannii]UTA01324.1 phage tail protein [Acinetobacter baumannii]HAV3807073.1 phage tail protein [Acinetobacter baumannii]